MKLIFMNPIALLLSLPLAVYPEFTEGHSSSSGNSNEHYVSVINEATNPLIRN